MARCIVFCEGRRDIVFFNEVISNAKQAKTRLISAKDLAKYSRGDNGEVLLTDCGGVPNIYSVIKVSVRELLGAGNPSSFCAIGDSDRVSFTKMTTAVDQLLKTPCRLHNIEPKLVVNTSRESFIVKDLKSETSLPVKMFLVRHSLESRLHSKIKERFPKDRIDDESEMIKRVSVRHFAGDTDRLFRKSAEWLKDEPWLVAISDWFAEELQ